MSSPHGKAGSAGKKRRRGKKKLFCVVEPGRIPRNFRDMRKRGSGRYDKEAAECEDIKRTLASYRKEIEQDTRRRDSVRNCIV